MLVQVAVGIIFDNEQRILVSQRKKSSHLAELWEFPGGKVEPEETVYQALCRELYEEIGIVVETAKPLTEIQHYYDHAAVNLNIWLVKNFSGEARGCEGQNICWVSLSELATMPLPDANRKLLTILHSLQQSSSN